MSKTNERSNNFWLPLIITIVCGLAAGILGESLSRNYILGESSPLSGAGEVNLSTLNANDSGLVIRDAKKVVVNQDVKITEAISSVRPILVSVFKEIPELAKTDSRNPGYYKLDEPLFVGLVITSDGWVIAATDEAEKDLKAKSYVAISGDKQLYKIDKFSKLTNSSDNLLIFHLTGAANLPVKKIVARSELSLGQTLLVIDGFNSVWPTTLTSLIKTPAVLSSDYLNAHLSLAGSDNNDFKNSFVFNLSGDLVAIVSADNKVVPAFSYNSAWQSLFQKEAIGLPYLGVNYLDLSAIKTTAVSLTKGAWLYSAGGQLAVVKGSPAETAGLQSGDIITWVNNQELDASHDLADVLSGYKAGDSVILTYSRAGTEREVSVKLGAYQAPVK